MHSQARVLIIGAGIGGLATALALHHAGINTTVFERVSELREVGAGLGIWPNAVRAFQKIGFTNLLETIGQPISRSAILSWQGQTLAETPIKRSFGGPLMMVQRAELLAILYKAVGEGVVHTNAACVGFDQDETSVRVHFADGQEVNGDLLVGADGLYSVIRSQLFGAAKPRYSGQTAYRGIAHMAPRQGYEQMATETWGSGRIFGLVPLTQGRMYWYAAFTTAEGMHGQPQERKQELLELFQTCHEPVPGVIKATEACAILRNDIYDRPPLPGWSKGRVTLLGDAAHPMTPNLGQGANQAIEDAVALAACLKAENDVSAAFHAYEARRLKQANAMVQQSARFGQLAHLQQPLTVKIRDTMLKKLPSQLLLRQVERILKDEGPAGKLH
jgi:2-polyprenyl-6-methoxyphenol hydroxylase-like FAD-dependent oxidoreductase